MPQIFPRSANTIAKVSLVALPLTVAGLLWVGVIDGVAQGIAAEDDHEAMLADRLDEHFDARDLDLLQLAAHGDAAFRGGPARAAVAGSPVRSHRRRSAGGRRDRLLT